MHRVVFAAVFLEGKQGRRAEGVSDDERGMSTVVNGARRVI